MKCKHCGTILELRSGAKKIGTSHARRRDAVITHIFAQHPDIRRRYTAGFTRKKGFRVEDHAD